MPVFDQFSIGGSAMRAFRLGMNIAGYNVANANTPGFSRRRVELGTMSIVSVPGGYSGMGVDVSSLHRVRDPFLDFAVRRESTRFGFDSSRADILGALEPALGEVDTAALRSSISDFFDALENLSIQPNDGAIRQDVVSAAQRLAGTLRQTDNHLAESRRAADDKAVAQVDRINAIVDRLSQSNVEIVGLEAGGKEASDVRDERDRLLDELSGLIPARAVEENNGEIAVFIDGTGDTLVSGSTAHKLEISRDSEGMARVQVSRSGEIVDLTGVIRSGSLGGYLSARDDDLPVYRDQLNQLASNLVTEFNQIHTSGFDRNGDPAGNLFEPDPPGANAAAAIHVNPAIVENSDLFAAADAPGEPGNNTLILQMLDLRTAGVSGLQGLTFTGFAADIIADVGRDRATAEASEEASAVIVDSLEGKRQGISAVSLDEEAANLAKWQQSFDAAARFMQTVNRITETALNLIPG